MARGRMSSGPILAAPMNDTLSASQQDPRASSAALRWFLRALAAAGAALLGGGLYLLSTYSYLLFHSLVEMFGIVVACGIFVIAWNSRSLQQNGYFLFLGVGYLAVGATDLLHTLAYKGMGVLPGFGSNATTQLWVGSRCIEATSLLLAPMFLHRKLRAGRVLAVYLGALALLMALVFGRVFPVCYVDGLGLTTFKKVSEYAICGAFAASIAVMLHYRARFAPRVLAPMVVAAALTIASELSFTLYVGVYDLANLIGHVLKLVSFYLIYRAVIQTALARPYELLFRDLKQTEAELRLARDDLERRVRERTAELAEANVRLTGEVRERTEAQNRLTMERKRLFSVLQMLPGYVALSEAGPSPSFRFVNDRFLELVGDPGGKPCHELLRQRSRPCTSCPVNRVIETGKPRQWEWQAADGRTFSAWAYPFTDVDGTRLALQLGIDITEQKLLEGEVLKASELEKQRIGQDLHDSLSQTLSGVCCLAEALYQRLASTSASETGDAARIRSILADSVAQARSLARGLNPVGLGPESLMIAMKELAERTSKLFGVRCEFRCEGPVLVRDGAAARHLYRIAQEAAGNAVRHGRAKTVTIELAPDDGDIVLSVEDDGIGLPEDVSRSTGTGLRIMKHRAESIGAELGVGRRAEGGTIVTCRLPDGEPSGA